MNAFQPTFFSYANRNVIEVGCVHEFTYGVRDDVMQKQRAENQMESPAARR